MNETIFVNGQTVWVLDQWDCIDECEVLEIPQWNTNYYKLKIKNGGWYNQPSSNIFSTYYEALIEKTRRIQEKVNKYKSKINNLKELLNFMLSQMCGHETSDSYAIIAVEEKILELTGINLDEED